LVIFQKATLPRRRFLAGSFPPAEIIKNKRTIKIIQSIQRIVDSLIYSMTVQTILTSLLNVDIIK